MGSEISGQSYSYGWATLQCLHREHFTAISLLPFATGLIVGSDRPVSRFLSRGLSWCARTLIVWIGMQRIVWLSDCPAKKQHQFDLKKANLKRCIRGVDSSCQFGLKLAKLNVTAFPFRLESKVTLTSVCLLPSPLQCFGSQLRHNVQHALSTIH